MKKVTSIRSNSVSKIPKKINKSKTGIIKNEALIPQQEILLRNLEFIDKLIYNSQQIVEQQDYLLNRFSKLNLPDDNKLDINNNQDFINHLENYSNKLNNILSKIKIQNEFNDEMKSIISN